MNSLEKTILLPDDWPIRSLRLVYSKRRTTSLRFSLDSGLVVRCPIGLQVSTALAFVHSKKQWILQQHDRYDLQTAAFPHPPRGSAWCRGEIYALRATSNGLETGVHTKHKEIVYLQSPDPKTSRSRVLSWLKADLDERILSELMHLQLREVAPFSALPEYHIRSMKSRWGSCSRNGSMRFNLALEHLDDACLRYVVCHEVAHLVHFHHGGAFHALLEVLCPGEKKAAAVVQRHAHILLRGGVNWPVSMKKAGE